MGFLDVFRKPVEPEPLLPLPRATRVWPKAQPAAPKLLPADPPAPPKPPAVLAAPQRTAPLQTTPKPVPAPPRPLVRTADAPVRIAAVAPPPTPRADDTSLQRMAPAQRREAGQVASAFATWKQSVAAKTAAPLRDEASDIVLKPVDAPPPARREDPVLHIVRAAAQAARGEHADAVAAYTRALDIDPKCVTAYAARAASYEALGDLAAAKRDYAKSIEIEVRHEINRLARPL